MLLPYRVKNPPKQFPYATVTLMAMNVIVYFGTTNGLFISEGMVKAYGFAWGKTPPWNMFTAAFLHGDIFHILGNMLFLWIFGGATEDRLGRPKFVAMYLLAGISGSLLQTVLDLASAGEPRYCIGASGCIMGVLGAYWYLFPWSTVCVFYFVWFFLRIWAGSFDIAALWVIGVYFVMDLAKGVFSGSYGADTQVAHFAHVGGVFTGLLFCLAIRAKRDTEAMSDARRVQADMKDVSLLPLDALETMLAEDPGNPEIIRAMVKPAIDMNRPKLVEDAMAQAGPAMIDKDADLVAYYLVTLRGNAALYQPAHLLRLAGKMEKANHGREAIGAYQALVQTYPTAPDVEMALYRMALDYWDLLKDAENARRCLRQMAQFFPKGEMVPFGRDLWTRINSQTPAEPASG